jgi:hypothetical protein
MFSWRQFNPSREKSKNQIALNRKKQNRIRISRRNAACGFAGTDGELIARARLLKARLLKASPTPAFPTFGSRSSIRRKRDRTLRLMRIFFSYAVSFC